MTSIVNSSSCMISISSMISFGSFDPIMIEFSPLIPRAITHQNVQSTVGDIVPSDESDDEGWILVTHKRGRKKNVSNSKSVSKRVRMVEVISQTPKVVN